MITICSNCNYPLADESECPGCGEPVAKSYREFLESKIVLSDRTGFDIDVDNPALFPHQQVAVRWAASIGRGLIAASFGLGKTRIQCELARQIHERTGKRFLVVCPLGVKHQFADEDGPAMGQVWQYIRTDLEIEQSSTPYLITNYERVRDGDITPDKHDFAGVSLDEGDVLRSLGSKTYDVFSKLFENTPYRFVNTATPSPNEFTELLGYAQFLGIMDRGQALTRWFKRDTTHAGHLTLHPLHEHDFWMWVSSWALFLFLPSDLGFSDDGYSLPEMEVVYHRLGVDQRRAWKQIDNFGQHRLLLNPASGVKAASAEKRETLSERIDCMKEIVAENPDRHYILWHHLEDERRAIEKSIPQSLSVYGSQDIDERERRVLQFIHGEIPILASKPSVSGSGCNFQRHCSDAIFLGIDYKFKDWIQAVHRIHRFQQTHKVTIHLIYAESEEDILKVLLQKWNQYDEQVQEMRKIVQKYGLSHDAMKLDLNRTIGVPRVENKQTLFTAVNNDCVDEVKKLADDSIDLIHTSVPFGNHYSYTASVEDFGHNLTDDLFWKQMDFLIPDLYRVLKPGRVAAIHVKDRILYGWQNRTGILEVEPFSDDCVRAFRKHGFAFEGRCTITTDVVRENNSTYRLGWSEQSRDATKMGFGLPEYLLLFRKKPTDNTTARADDPVSKSKEVYTRARWQIDAHSFWRSNGNRPMFPDELYDYEAHVGRLQQKDDANNLPATFFLEPPASPSPEWVWDDVNSMLCLNAEQTKKGEQNHICPLPFDIVQRVITRWSNEGDLILDPFSGLGTVGYIAMKLGRRAYLVELKREYYEAGLRYCQEMEQQKLTPTLFDWVETKVKATV